MHPLKITDLYHSDENTGQRCVKNLKVRPHVVAVKSLRTLCLRVAPNLTAFLCSQPLAPGFSLWERWLLVSRPYRMRKNFLLFFANRRHLWQNLCWGKRSERGVNDQVTTAGPMSLAHHFLEQVTSFSRRFLPVH